MTPQAFVQKWKQSQLKERAASQEHFIDLCHMLGEATPAEADADGSWYTFEKRVEKAGGGDGSADVWRKDCFAWEYKGKHRDLWAAFGQLSQYSYGLGNPPLLIVSDMETIRVHTNFQNTIPQTHEIALEELKDFEKRRILEWAFREPGKLRPNVTRERLTETAAERFAGIAQNLRDRGHDPQRVAHFVTRLLFCMFAEDIRLLPDRLFTRLLESCRRNVNAFPTITKPLFSAMREGGVFGADVIDWFNGGLFDDDDVIPLLFTEVEALYKCALLDWSAIEPSIFGTLFERGLDPSKRSQLGAHYTDRRSILRIVEPVVLRPLRDEWAVEKQTMKDLVAQSKTAKSRVAGNRLFAEARQVLFSFLDRLKNIRVLDPACGSGNFLYVALLGLKDLESEVMRDGEQEGFSGAFHKVDPQVVRGIEINPYAAELARVTIWIGQIQWMREHNQAFSQPILQPLDQIECRDALVDMYGKETEWPEAECIIGNPPFLGNKKMIGELGEPYVQTVRDLYEFRVPKGADYVTFWFEKARRAIETGRTQRAGLVATNSIRGGENRKVIERIQGTAPVFEAWSDEEWILDGASVRVSILCFGRSQQAYHLDGVPVAAIHPDLTSSTNLTSARRLLENRDIIFMGTTKVGAFDVDGSLARSWLASPNPNGRSNAAVVRPWVNTLDVVRRPQDKWVVDFGVEMGFEEAALYEAPFEYIRREVQVTRQMNRRAVYSKYWWRFGEPRPKLRRKLKGLSRFIATPSVAKHRVFVWMPVSIVPDHQLFAIARDDDATFGILHSRFHEAWSLRLGTWLGAGNDPRYTPSTTFETFPFPRGLSPNVPAVQYSDDPRAAAIADAARRLNELRETWLNPSELVQRVPEVVAGFPDRIEALNEEAALELRKRTLTNLYNERPTWLQNAHQRLDKAVASAYGWPSDIDEEHAMEKLLDLNSSRSGGLLLVEGRGEEEEEN